MPFDTLEISLTVPDRLAVRRAQDSRGRKSLAHEIGRAAERIAFDVSEARQRAGLDRAAQFRRTAGPVSELTMALRIATAQLHHARRSKIRWVQIFCDTTNRSNRALRAPRRQPHTRWAATTCRRSLSRDVTSAACSHHSSSENGRERHDAACASITLDRRPERVTTDRNCSRLRATQKSCTHLEWLWSGPHLPTDWEIPRREPPHPIEHLFTVRFLVDTDVVSYALSRNERVLTHWQRYRYADIAISAITEAELRYAVARYPHSRIAAMLERFLQPYEIVEFSTAHARVLPRLERDGQPAVAPTRRPGDPCRVR
jgi:predicted nucleic acid-binding protein